MLFLGWLAVCFLVVGLINFYLRRFGLPKRKTPAGGDSKSAGYGSGSFSGGSGASIGGLLHGAGFSRGTGSACSGESVHWINSILSWIYQTQNRVPDFVDSWLTSLTTEAEHLNKEIHIVFEGIHGSPPEFSNFRSESTSTDKIFTILTTVTLKDVTLQTTVLGKSPAAKATQGNVKCDVYIQTLTGQVKSQAQLAHNELNLQLEFVSEPTVKLQIRPTRTDSAIDSAAVEKIVRASLSKAPMRVHWTSSHSTGRPSHLRIIEPNNEERSPVRRLASGTQQLPPLRSPPISAHSTSVDGYGSDFSPSPSSSAYVTPSPPPLPPPHSPPSAPAVLSALIPGSGQPILTRPPADNEFRGQQQELQYSGTTFQGQEQVFGSVQGQQYSPTAQQQQQQSLMQGQQTFQGIGGGQELIGTQGHLSQQTLSDGPKLFVRVVKANGLMDTDFGTCSALCRVHVDTPPQDFVTNVIRNTVNPYWDEQFISEFDHRTKQIQFEVLDRDRQQGNDLLGKAVVLVDEIRRMPSSRQIIPLTGKPKSRTSTSGSVTVEFIFQDSVVDSPASSSSLSSSSTAPVSPLGIGQGQNAGQKLSISSLTQLSPTAKALPLRKVDKTSRVGSADYSPYSGRSGATGTGPSQLSAHNLALTSSQPAGARLQESPTVVITGAESLRSATLQPSGAQLKFGATGNIEGKKKESFANTLKRTLGRVKIKPRSQSADRTTGRSLREENLLRPPDYGGFAGQQSAQTTAQQQTNRGAGSTSDLVGSDVSIRKGRSNSFGSSLRRIFRREKKDSSHPGSMTKPIVSSSSSATHLGRGGGEGGSREALTPPGQGYDRSRRQNTPVPSDDRFPSVEFPYSSSVPAAASPLQRA